MSSQSKWKLVAVLIVASALLGAVGWQQFALRPTPPTTTMIAPVVTTHATEATEKYLSLLRSLKDGKFASYAEKHNLCFQDHKLTELEVKFLSDSERYGKNLLNSYIEEAEHSAAYTDLGIELRKIPEVQSALARTDVTVVESIEDIVHSILLSKNPGVPKNLSLMLSEGIPEKRKHCVPLQALEWFYVDKEPNDDNPLEAHTFEVRSFVETIWRHSSTSDVYNSSRWKDFDEVVDRLNSPSLVRIYAWDNIGYAWQSPGVPEARRFLQSPLETFKRRLGNCGDQARFIAYCLHRAHYNANYCRVDWDSRAHAVCVYYDKNGLLYFLDNTYTISGSKHMALQGPFESIKEICERYPVFYSQGEGVWKRCYLVPPTQDSFDLAQINRYLYMTNPQA